MARDLVRNAQQSPHITAKELQRVANTGLAVHMTTIQHTLTNKDLHGGVARKNNLNTTLNLQAGLRGGKQSSRAGLPWQLDRIMLKVWL